jgi:hypothetical protein
MLSEAFFLAKLLSSKFFTAGFAGLFEQGKPMIGISIFRTNKYLFALLLFIEL